VSDAPLIVEVEQGIARLTLNRPDAGNAVDLPMARALVAASIRCVSDASIRCVVLTGAGRLFCAGGDVAAMRAAGNGAQTLLSELAGTFHMALARFARMPKPFVTLVNGPAAGGGFGLALSGDVVIAGRAAHFTPAYSMIGLVPDGGLSWLLPRLVGMKRAQEIILTNRRVKADEAASIGMVTRVVDDEALAGEGDAISRTLADGATRALGVTRAMLLDGAATTYEAQLEAEVRGISAAGAGAESREGIAALFAKRPPDFRGA
jgi:2-(1,2-epoxy-1,2-dihydrophenyl)acetyl-CoA isomerase